MLFPGIQKEQLTPNDQRRSSFVLEERHCNGARVRGGSQ